MAGFQIVRPDTAFSLSGSRKRPRHTSEAHLKAIRFLPCVICLKRPVEAAHIRTASLLHGKRSVGVGEKSDDRWTLPLCSNSGGKPGHHSEQHSMNEMEFYKRYGVDPFGTALALWGSEGDEEAMLVIVERARTR